MRNDDKQPTEIGHKKLEKQHKNRGRPFKKARFALEGNSIRCGKKKRFRNIPRSGPPIRQAVLIVLFTVQNACF